MEVNIDNSAAACFIYLSNLKLPHLCKINKAVGMVLTRKLPAQANT